MEMPGVGGPACGRGLNRGGVRRAIPATKEDLERSIGAVLDDPDVGILVLDTADMKSLSHTMRRRLETVARPVVIGVGPTEDEDLRTKVKRAIGVDLFKGGVDMAMSATVEHE